MLKRAIFGPYLPDLPPADQLVVARNVYATSAGYGPVGGFQAVTPPLAGITGGASFVSSKGDTSTLGGTGTSLNRYVGGVWQSLLTEVAATARWRFVQFGDNVIAVNGGPPVSYQLGEGAAGPLGGSPPAADLVTVVRDRVVLAGDPQALLTVTWSGDNRSNFWPDTDPDAPDQYGTDRQEMLDGGRVMGLAGGEYGIVLQRNAVKRMSFQGGDIVFSFDEIASNVGCMAKGSVAQSGRLTFFLSDRGFMSCDGNGVDPIGDEQVNATFFRTYSRQDIVNRIYAATDPRRNIVIWIMPGTPGTLWCYNYALRRWTTISIDVRLGFSGFTADTTLEQLDARYGTLEAVPFSLDDAAFSGGNPLLLLANTSGALGTLNGEPLDGVLSLARQELAAGRARVREVRPITDAGDVIVAIEGRMRGSERPVVRQSISMRANGTLPVRANAHLFDITATFRGAWTYAQGLEITFESGGTR